MDLNALVRLIYSKHELMLGVSITLLLIVTVLMLVRSVMEDRQTEKKSGKSADLDPKTLNTAIEGAMKKVLADKGIQGALAGAAAGASGAASSNGDSSVAHPDALELKKSLSEKEAKIAALMTDIEALKAAADKVQPTEGGATSGVDVSALQAKLAELQAKLAEYEIIEDDIADLSMYKEENKKLKAELANMKAAVETAQTQVQAASAAVDAVPQNEDPVQAAQAAVKSPPPPQEKFELDKNDSVMNEFAEAISGTKPAAAQPETSFESQLVVAEDSPLADPQAAIDAILSQSQEEKTDLAELEVSAPLADPVVELEVADLMATDSVKTDLVGADATDTEIAETDVADTGATNAAAVSALDEALDTNKLQAEVSKLAAELESMALAADSEPSVLEESLDTDKLMRELAGSDETSKVGAEHEEPVPVSAEAPREGGISSSKPEIVESGVKARPQAAAVEDDLLAEFKDVDFQNSKTTKGS